MNLKQYLKVTKMSARDLAKIAEVTPCTIYNILLKKELKLSTALKISKCTKMAVTCEDMAPEI